MSLNKSKLHDDIQAAFDAAKAQESPDDATPVLVSGLTNAIDAYVRGARVKSVVIDLDTGNQVGERPLE